jgi:hypothetical protein
LIVHQRIPQKGERKEVNVERSYILVELQEDESMLINTRIEGKTVSSLIN